MEAQVDHVILGHMQPHKNKREEVIVEWIKILNVEVMLDFNEVTNNDYILTRQSYMNCEASKGGL